MFPEDLMESAFPALGFSVVFHFSFQIRVLPEKA